MGVYTSEAEKTEREGGVFSAADKDGWRNNTHGKQKDSRHK